MKVICNNCGYVIDRDKTIEGKIVEDYKNAYGTHCPKCGILNKPFDTEMTEGQSQVELLREKVRDTLRKKLRR